MNLCNDNTINIKTNLINDLRNYISKNGYPKRKKELNSKNGLKDIYTYKKYLDGDLVDWIKLCGFTLTEDEIYEIETRGGKSYNLSKKEIIKEIYALQTKLNRPLMYDDFRGKSKDGVKMAYIKRYWGTLNGMKKELGLQITQENMKEKSKTIDEIKQIIKNICDKVKNNENRIVISWKDFDEDPNSPNAGSLMTILKRNCGISLREYLLELGFQMQDSGSGISYTFSDGERTTSRYEYQFSNFLRSHLNLSYDKDYFRDVKYKDFINSVQNNINCDYKIYCNKVVYVEIAGILNNHTKYYKNNIEIYNSKSREKYRLSLMRKEELLKDNNLDYFILFPEDLTDDNLKGLFKIFL